MIRFVDKNANNCGRIFYEALIMYDYEYANRVAIPVDEKFVDYDKHNVFYLISQNHFYSFGKSEVTADVIKNVKEGKYRLLFDFSFEGEWRGVERFIEEMDKHGIPEESYIAITGADFINEPSVRNVLHCPMFEAKARYSLRQNLCYNFGVTEHKNFVMLNARPRPHRVLLTYLMNERGLLDNGYCSLPQEDNNWEKYTIDNSLENCNWLGFEFNEKSINKLRNVLPLEVDKAEQLNSLELNDAIKADIYQYVDFAVITETHIDTGNDMVFVTEKIMKAIANRIPFIVYGDRYTLKYLKRLGYKTYDFLIDESYDEMPAYERTYKVVDEIERLCNVDFSEYHNQIAEVAEHNYNLLLDNPTYKPRFDYLVESISDYPARLEIPKMCIVRDNMAISHELEQDIENFGNGNMRVATSAEYQQADKKENLVLVPDVGDHVTEQDIPKEYKKLYREHNAYFLFKKGTEVDIPYRYNFIDENTPACVKLLRLFFDCPQYTKEELFDKDMSVNCSFWANNVLVFYICKELNHSYPDDVASMHTSFWIRGDNRFPIHESHNYIFTGEPVVSLEEALQVPDYCWKISKLANMEAQAPWLT